MMEIPFQSLFVHLEFMNIKLKHQFFLPCRTFRYIFFLPLFVFSDVVHLMLYCFNVSLRTFNVQVGPTTFQTKFQPHLVWTLDQVGFLDCLLPTALGGSCI